MSDPKKKLTKKQQKAINHAKLMSSKKGGIPGASTNYQNNNVVELNAFQKDKDKKAA